MSGEQGALEPQQELERLQTGTREAVTLSLPIDAFPETIFDCLDDPKLQKEWLPDLEQTTFPAGRPQGPQAGTRFNQLVRQRGGLAEYEGLILVHKRPRQLVVRVGNRHFTALVDYKLTSLGRGSRLDYSCRVLYHSLFGRLTGAIVSGANKRIAIDQLVALKHFAEAGA